MVLAKWCRVDLVMVVLGMASGADAFTIASRQTVYPNNFELLRNFCADIQRVGVIVGIWMFHVATIEPALESC